MANSLSDLGAEPYRPPTQAPTKPSGSLSDLGAEPYEPVAATSAAPEQKGQEGLFTRAGQELTEGLTKIGRAFQPNSGVQNILGIPGSGRVGSALSGVAEIVGAPFAPIGYVGSRGSAASVNNQALDARIARAEKLKREHPEVAGADPDVNALSVLKAQRAIPEAERIRQDQETARSLAENTVGMLTGVAGAASPGWLVRAPGNIVRAVRGAETAGQAAKGPLALRPEVSDIIRTIQEDVAGKTVHPGGGFRIEEVGPAARPAGTARTLSEAERILSGGQRGTQRTLEAAQDLQTGRGPLDLGEAGKRMAAQRGAYQPAEVSQPERQVVRHLEEELRAPASSSTVRPSPLSPQAGALRAPDVPQRGVAGSMREFFAPASSSKEAGETAAIIRTRLGEQARSRAVTADVFKGVERTFDRTPEADRLVFIRNMEHGASQKGPVLDSTAQALRKSLDEKWSEVTKLNPKAAEEYIDNYFPHLWENDRAAATVYAAKRSTVEGPKGFLKERTLPTVDVGLQAGLKLKDTNPARLVAQRLNDMDRYITGQRVIADLKDSGLARSFAEGEVIPAGWQRLPGSIPHASGLYVPQDVALVMDRWLTPGLSGAKLYDTARSFGNSLNQFQLGFSAFHLFFTSMDAMASRVAVGLKELATPGMRLRGAKDVALGFSPTTPFTNAIQGDKVLKAYLNKPGFEEFNHLADAVVKAGGRTTMDPFYRTGKLSAVRLDQTAMGQFSRGVRESADALKATKPHTAVGQAMNTVSDLVSYPIMQKIVPNQKLGVFAKMAEYEISRLGPTATDGEVTLALQRAWDSVDNRMGQMVYDNLFWNKTFKDLAMVATRSVGWNTGTIREIGGGVGEFGKAAGKVARGSSPEFTHKMSYVIAFPMVAGLYGAITQYLMTGEGPKELKDYFAPRTGKVFPDGRPERVQLASYMRDVLAATKGITASPLAPVKLGENLWEMGKHKLNPLLSTLTEMMNNEDFYGAAIRDPDDPEIKQVMDSLVFLAGQWTPIGVRQITNTGQMPPKPGFERSYPGLSLVGITPAPASIERTAEQQAEVQRKIDRMKLSKKRKKEQGD